MVLLDLYENYLSTNDLQFGFKKKNGCPSAVFAIRQTVNYYNEIGGNLNVGSLWRIKGIRVS